MNKVIEFKDAIRQIENGMTIAIGGMTLYRKPVRFVTELIKFYISNQQPNNLTLLSFTAGYECDLLVASGMIEKVRTCYFGLESFGFAPVFTYLANRGEIEIIEETEASIAFGIRATLADVGFCPGRGWIGTDLPKLRPDVKTIIDPYTQEELIAFPAIKPDVAIIHAIKADKDGNAIIGKNKGIDEELSLASPLVFITAEEIVSELQEADIIAPCISGVIHAPHGAYPTSCHPLYPIDGLGLLEYIEEVTDLVSWKNYFHKKYTSRL